jgi:hypothetical protein
MVYKIKRRIQRFTNPRRAKHKGHEIILKYKSLISSELAAQDVIIEIGSDREAGSTLHLAKLAKENAARFITVDVDSQTTMRAETIIKEIDQAHKAVNDYGEVFLASFNEPVKLVYLDAFDLPGDWHSEEVRENYSSRNIELTLENCYKMHLECARAIIDNVPAGGFVCFDDVNPVDAQDNMIFRRVGKRHMEWSGKGKTAIPFLLKNGFEVIDNIRACVLLRRANNDQPAGL